MSVHMVVASNTNQGSPGFVALRSLRVSVCAKSLSLRETRSFDLALCNSSLEPCGLGTDS